MKIKPDELTDRGYVLFDELEPKDFFYFINNSINK